MRTGKENPTGEHTALALYLVGGLDEAERVRFEAHLAGCWECLGAAGDLGSVTSALPALEPADWEAIATLPPEFTPTPDPDPAVGAPDPGAPPTSPAPPSAVGPPDPRPAPAPVPAPDPRPAPAPDPAPATDTAATRPTGPTGVNGPGTAGVDPEVTGRSTRRGLGGRTAGRVRPGGGRPGTTGRSDMRPARGPDGVRRRGLRLWAGAAVAVLAVVVAGGVVAGVGFGGRDGVVLTATGEAPGQGATLSVTITTDEDGSTIRIVADGLRQGLRYRLFGVTRDGATHVVRDWTASTGPQEVTAELSLPVDDLAFVTVGLVDGTAVVTAPISR